MVVVVVNNPTAIKRRILAIILPKKRENLTTPQNPKMKRKINTEKNTIPPKSLTIMITMLKNLIRIPLKKRKSMKMTITNPNLMTITNPSMGVVAMKKKPITMNMKRKTPMMIMRVVAPKKKPIMMIMVTKRKAIMIIMEEATKRKAITIIMGVDTKRKIPPMPKNLIMTTKNHFMF